MTSRIKQLDGDQGAVDILDIDTPDIGTYNFTIRSAADFTGISIILFGLSGVNSGTPRRTPIGDTNYGGTASATATTESGDFVLGAFSTVNSATLDGSLTSLYGNLLGLNEYGSAGYLTASGATATVQATQTANQWAAAALPYIPAGGGSIVPQAMAGYRQQ
jgi:hypothetical protein